MTQMVITLTAGGMIKRVPLAEYRMARRGGKGRTAPGDQGENSVRQMIVTDLGAKLLFLTLLGRVCGTCVDALPLLGIKDNSVPSTGFLGCDAEDRVVSVVTIPPGWGATSEIAFVSAAGRINVIRAPIHELCLSPWIQIMHLPDSDQLAAGTACDLNGEVVLVTRAGRADCILLASAAEASNGFLSQPYGFNLEENDRVVSIAPLSRYTPDNSINGQQMIIMVTNRGIITARLTQDMPPGLPCKLNANNNSAEHNADAVIAAFTAFEGDEVFLATDSGRLLRLPVSDFAISRGKLSSTYAVRMVGSESVVAAAAYKPQ